MNVQNLAALAALSGGGGGGGSSSQNCTSNPQSAQSGEITV